MLLANTGERSRSRKRSTVSAIQDIPRIWCNLKVHYRIHKIPPPVHILSQVNQARALSTDLFNNSFSIILLSIYRSSKWFFLSPILVTILLFLMLPPGIIFAEQQKLTHPLGPQKSWGIWFETHCLFCCNHLSLGFVNSLNFDVTLQIRKWTKPKEWRSVQ